MTSKTDQPDVRATATFSWAPPDAPPGTKPVEFTATLYDTAVVGVSGPAPYNGLTTPLQWDEGRQAIVRTSGYWDHKLGWDDRTTDHFSLKATNALRRQLGLGPHPATPNFPGAE